MLPLKGLSVCLVPLRYDEDRQHGMGVCNGEPLKKRLLAKLAEQRASELKSKGLANTAWTLKMVRRSDDKLLAAWARGPEGLGHVAWGVLYTRLLNTMSQRYKDVSDELLTAGLREARMQDKKNRQGSLPCVDDVIAENWQHMQEKVFDIAKGAYEWALERGIAKEQARALLPEGLTPSKMYANGTMRSWIHYLRQRLDPSTQKEHRLIAEEVLYTLSGIAPVTMSAFFNDRLHPNSDS